MWINMAYIVGTQIQQQTPNPFHYHLFYYSTQVSFSLYRKLNLLFHVYRFSWYKNLLSKIHLDEKDDCIMQQHDMDYQHSCSAGIVNLLN